MRFLILFLLFFVISSCKKEDKPDFITPFGLEVSGISDEGSFTGGYFTYDNVLLQLDSRVYSWLDLRGWGNEPTARGVKYYIYDNWYTFIQGQMCSGWTNYKEVGICLYSQRYGPVLDQTSPPWTRIYNPATGNWNWGVCDDDSALPATGHELDHCIGIHHFEMMAVLLR